MVEKLLLDYIEQKLDTPCFMEVPETAPDTFIVIEKTSGSCLNRLYSSTFAIQSYAPSLLEATELNYKLLDIMPDFAFFDSTITGCRLNSNYNFTDTATKRYRYQAVFDISHY